MASTQEPEVQFAQRLASNEKPVRAKALKRLRKYITVRSQKETGGFTGDELLRLWKGLFYCLWMQDKPLLQEQLSSQISTLIHSFHSISGQLLYLESFLQTFRREWTGIDRLRMDKFFQLVRFMFRQAFELLRRKNWDSSAVGRFLELLTAQLLQTGSAAPSELQFHILDLYMTELAAVGSAELTAEQNLVFIEPFCNTAAKTKDRVLFGAICSSIFSTMINQAPFAIEDLIKEVKALEDSDSGQASDEDDEDHTEEKRSLERGSNGKQVNGCKCKGEEDDFDHLDDLDAELPCDADDDDIGPVLQFDYASVADKLLELASQSNTPSYNRQKLYRIIKVLRDLSEGIFPQDEDPEDESTDEDDDMFGSKKKMKRAVAPTQEEGAPLAKKRKKQKAATISNDLKKDECEQADLSTNDQKKRKKRKKKKAGHGAGDEDNSGKSNQGQTVTVPPESLLQSEVTKQVSVTEDSSKPLKSTTNRKDQTQAPSMKKKKRAMGKERLNLTTAQPEVLSVADTSDPKNQSPTTEEQHPKQTTAPAKKKKKGLGAKPGGRDGESHANALSSEDGVILEQCDDSAQGGLTAWLDKPSDTRPTAKVKTKKKRPKTDQEGKPAAEVTSELRHKTNNGVRQKEKVRDKQEKDRVSDVMTLKAVTDQSAKKKKRIKQKDQAESPEGEKPPFEMTLTTPAKQKNKANGRGKIGDENQAQVDGELPPDESRKPSRKKRKIPVTFEYEADDRETELGNDVGEPASTQSKAMNDFISFQSHVAVPTPLFCKAKRSPGTPLSSRKKCKTPKSDSKKVTFGLKSNKTAEFRKNDRSLLVSPDGSSRVPFDPKQKPKFGVLKSPATPVPGVRTSFRSPKSSAKRRPSAADFF